MGTTGKGAHPARVLGRSLEHEAQTKGSYGQQRERALLDGGGPVRRGGDKKDGRGGQHRSGAREGQRQPDGPRSARTACLHGRKRALSRRGVPS